MTRTRLAALLLLACLASSWPAGAAPPVHHRAGPITLAGIYRLRGGPDTVSALELQGNGHFRFIFAAGALDLMAEGRWTSDGHSVILDTEPRPVPPVFSAGPVVHNAEAPFTIRVNNPGAASRSSISRSASPTAMSSRAIRRIMAGGPVRKRMPISPVRVGSSSRSACTASRRIAFRSIRRPATTSPSP